MKIDVILGLQWGDEGKGKIVDFLAQGYDVVARFQGGPNAGHTLKFDGKKFVLHTVPSGIFRSNCINLIGNGVVIDPTIFKKELRQITDAGYSYRKKLILSEKAHLIMPTHRMLDVASEAAKGDAKIGSTLKGIGPTYMDKTGRNGLRVGDLLEADFEKKYATLREKHLTLLKIYPEIAFDLEAEEKAWFESLDMLRGLRIMDTSYYINDALSNGKKVLAEGAQGSMLDIDFGTYPFVTSSNTITAGVLTGLGVAPQKIGRVIGITKAYCTRVGSGSFPTELNDADGERLRKVGMEFGSTTGRPRRCGWIDLPQLKYTMMLNGVTELCMTKLDVLEGFDTLKAATRYHYDTKNSDRVPYNLARTDLSPVYKSYKGWASGLNEAESFDSFPKNAKNYVLALEKELGQPIKMISVGPERKELVLR